MNGQTERRIRQPSLKQKKMNALCHCYLNVSFHWYTKEHVTQINIKYNNLQLPVPLFLDASAVFLQTVFRCEFLGISFSNPGLQVVFAFEQKQRRMSDSHQQILTQNKKNRKHTQSATANFQQGRWPPKILTIGRTPSDDNKTSILMTKTKTKQHKTKTKTDLRKKQTVWILQSLEYAQS